MPKYHQRGPFRWRCVHFDVSAASSTRCPLDVRLDVQESVWVRIMCSILNTVCVCVSGNVVRRLVNVAFSASKEEAMLLQCIGNSCSGRRLSSCVCQVTLVSATCNCLKSRLVLRKMELFLIPLHSSGVEQFIIRPVVVATVWAFS